MISYFFDTSLLLKVYAEEEGSQRVRSIDLRARISPPTAQVVVCDLIVPEAVAGLARKSSERSSGISDLSARRTARKLVREIAERDGPYIIVEASSVIGQAAALALKHRLRGADSIQLAAAIEAKAQIPGRNLIFGTTDLELRKAAQAAGFEILEL